MAKLKVSELPVASSVSLNDTMYVVQNSTSKQISVATLRANILSMPQVSTSTNYSLVLTDQNKHIHFTNSSNVDLTIPNNGDVDFPIGTTIVVVADTPANVGLTILPGTNVKARLAGTENYTQVNVNAKGVATMLNVGPNVWFVYGQGLWA